MLLRKANSLLKKDNSVPTQSPERNLSNGEYRYFTDNDTVCCRSGDMQTERHSQCTNDRMTVSLEIRNDKNQDLTRAATTALRFTVHSRAVNLKQGFAGKQCLTKMVTQLSGVFV